MKFGYVKVSAITPSIKVAEVSKNTENVKKEILVAESNGVEIALFPELCLSGYTVGDLFLSEQLLSLCKKAIQDIADFTKDKKILVSVGFPFEKDGGIFNANALIQKGKILAIIPKFYPNDSDGRYESRYFSSCFENQMVSFNGQTVPFGRVMLKSVTHPEISVCVVIGSDINHIKTPLVDYSLNGASIVLNPTANPTTIGSFEKSFELIKTISETFGVGVLTSNAGTGESSTDAVYGGGNFATEVGEKVSCTLPFDENVLVTELDVGRINNYKMRYIKRPVNVDCSVQKVIFDTEEKDIVLTREIEKEPFLSSKSIDYENSLKTAFDVQVNGLKKRMSHVKSNSLVLGLSGGLDSTLALLIAVEATKRLGLSPKTVIAVTMPCFGTTGRTYQNSIKLARALGTTLKKVDIAKSVTRHLKEIGHDLTTLDVTYENAQARERTQVIMDIANMSGGLVVGTGDLSELALGWATYNGDHMSNYGVNCSLPKTIVRAIVSLKAKESKSKLKAVLTDILSTPVSPELLPAVNGEISQKTEDIVGPYELHDFFLYHTIKSGFSAQKLSFIAKRAFLNDYDEKTIDYWLKTFVRRFFAQQFKRSCLPDGVRVGSISLSPRGSFVFPSDASSNDFNI